MMLLDFSKSHFWVSYCSPQFLSITHLQGDGNTDFRFLAVRVVGSLGLAHSREGPFAVFPISKKDEKGRKGRDPCAMATPLLLPVASR